MPEDETCEGFKNYETFSVAVVVDNDQSAHYHARSFVLELESIGREPWEIADALKDYHESAMPELDGFWSGLLRAGFETVDWMELADHWKDPEWRAAQGVAAMVAEVADTVSEADEPPLCRIHGGAHYVGACDGVA